MDCTALRVLVLYDHHYVHVKTIAHHLESFRRHSEFAVSYVASLARCEFDLDFFDAVIIHYSVKVGFPGHLSPSFASAVARYRGVKAIFLHDEYEAVDATCQAIEDLGIDVVFTCVPDASIPIIYPPNRFRDVEFVTVLTGYVPPDIHTLAVKPTRERPITIGYRGRNNAFWFGDLYREKEIIGRRMKELCDAHGLTTDIAWREEDRIYGDPWFRFLGDCKATLGTESGANILDRDGSIAVAVQRELLSNPAATYDEIRVKHLAAHEGKIVMNQASPRIFEAIACRTVLILFEGRYSDVVEPNLHFIPLKKDFSNVEDVLRRLRDDDALQAMADRAYRDVIESGKYSYERLVGLVDRAMKQHFAASKPRPASPRPASPRPASPRPASPWLPLPPCDALPGFRARYQKAFQARRLTRLWQALPAPLRAMLGPIVQRDRLKKLWVLSPASIRRLLRPLARQMRHFLSV